MNAQTYLLFFIIISIATIVSTFFSSYRTAKKEYLQKLKLDISVDQMIQSEDRIAEFLKANNLKPGETIEVIADRLNIVDGGVQDGLTGRAWLSSPDKDGKMTVVFKRGLSKEEHLFDFAHECGHRINHDPTPATRPEGYNKPVAEQLADYTGAALLMPLNEVYEFLTKNNYRESSKRQRQMLIRNLCKQYRVTEVIALRRIKEVYIVKHAMKKT